jgi:hypothetical protein
MPFKSEKQRKYLWANEPEIARDWTDTYGSKIHKAEGGRIPMAEGWSPGAGRDDRGYQSSHPSHSAPSRGDHHPPSITKTPTHSPSRGDHHPPSFTPTPTIKKSKGDGWIDRGLSYLKNKQKQAMISYFDRNKARYENKLRDIYNIEEDEELENYMSMDPLQFAKGKYAKNIDTYIDKVQEANILNKAIESGEFTQDDFTARLNRLNPPADDRGEGLPYIWPYPTASAPIEEEVEIASTDPIDLYRGSYRVDPRFLLAADGGRVPAAFGGIMDSSTGRRGYFLGSVGDALGDIVGGVGDIAGKAAKKIKNLAKSDVGRLALSYLATAGMANVMAPGPASWSGGLGKEGWLRPGGIMKNLSSAWAGDPTKTVAEGYKNLGPVKTSYGSILTGKDALNATQAAKKTKDAFSYKDALKWIIPGSVLAGATAEKTDELGGVEEDYNEDLAKWEKILAPYRGAYRVEDEFIKSAEGGRIGKQEGGLMNLGGMEKDYRNDGGFVPIGGQEKADDVPARLSRNEFVFTADAVRNAGGGDIDKGAEVMENVMKNLEAGGKVSEESQGKGGAQEMFEVSERLSEVV